jgi:peptide/nickel transport system ATP-binding protein/oligopeptide transport system ATP-binding protein
VTPEAPLLEVRDLVKWFTSHGAPVRAVDGVSFSVARGETVALVGESGCGKSTIARCLVRLLEPDRGAIAFRGADLPPMGSPELRRMRRDVQMVFQDPDLSLNRSFTIRKTLREPLQLHRIAEGPELDEALHDLMRRVRLDPKLLDRRPGELSGGQKQRVGIARAIATKPSFVVLDEPTSALDMSLRASLLDLLAELQEQLAMAYLFITHDFSTVRQIADRVLVMYRGKVVETDGAERVLDDPLHPYTQALISAIPVPEPRRRHRRPALREDAPEDGQTHDGCPFQDRCPHVMDACRSGEIPFFARRGRDVACLLYRDAAA